MRILSDTTAATAHQRLAAMIGPVVLQIPSGDAAAAAFAHELAEGSPLLEVVEGEDQQITLLDSYGRPTGIAFEGLPLGQELGVLLDDILAVSRGATSLSPLGRMQAKELSGSLQILVTPTCTRCSQAVRLAHAIALESRGSLTATAVDVSEQQALIAHFGVNTVPYFVWNGETGFAGPLPELILLQRLSDTAG